MTKVEDIFDVRYGHSLELNRLKVVKPGKGIAFVSRKMGDNGISAYVEEIPGIEPAPAGNLSCALGGNVLTTHLQEQPFYVGRDIALLKPKIELTKQEILFYCMCIKANRFRYSYGRQANRTLKEILIPKAEEIPEWVKHSNLDMYIGAEAPQRLDVTLDLATAEWRSFRIDSLFEIKKGRRLTKAKMQPGLVPFIGAIDSRNGVSSYVKHAIHDGNTITVNYNGAGVAEAFYQAVPFWASDDVNVLYPRFELTPAIALFITTVIRQEKYRFNYGRKWHMDRMKASTISLPVLINGIPNWKFMEDYIMALPFSSTIGATYKNSSDGVVKSNPPA